MNANQFETLCKALRFAVADHNHTKPVNEFLSWQQGSWGTISIPETEPDRWNLPSERLIGEDAYANPVVIIPLSCTTSCCIAGNVALATGHKFTVSKEWWYPGDDQIEVSQCTKDGEVHQISEVGQRELGITTVEADRLFNGGNEIETVVSYGFALAERYSFEDHFPDELMDLVDRDLVEAFDRWCS